MIDLRSDTVTKPSLEMYEAMNTAEVGDDVFGDDPTVIELETTVSDILGFEAGLFVTSGTQSNLTAVLTHCGRGDEYVIGEAYHVYHAEGVGTAALGGVIPQTVTVLSDGSVDLDEVEAKIKQETKATIRCLPLEINPEPGKCIVTGLPSAQRALFAIAY